MNEAATEVPRQVILLKRLVIGFSILLAGSAIFLAAIGLAGLGGRGFGRAALPVPDGCTVTQATGSGDRLILTLAGTGDCRRILIADMKTGRLLGSFDLKAP